MGKLRDLTERLRKSKRLTVALLIPALPFIALCLFMPSQFAFVVGDAAARVVPLLWAELIMASCFALLVLLLLAAKALDRTVLVAAAAPLIAAHISFLVAAGFRPVLVVALVALVLILWAISRKTDGLASLQLISWLRPIWVPVLAVLVLFLGAGLVSYLSPLQFPRSIGSLAILFLFMGTSALLLAAMAISTRFAVVSIGYAGIALLFLAPNNHEVPVSKARAAPLALEQTFVDWLASRADLDAYRSRALPYPVIIVSSEGGGIYAAAHAYGTLSRIASSCPTFSQHVFATVGVSGGAIGNALFVAGTDPGQKSYAPCGPAVAPVDPTPVVTDHLSPVLARLLLLESVDRLLPGQLIDHDRGQVLTDSFLSVSPDRAHSGAALTDSYDPLSARPALVSVTTDRNTGNRLILSPFQPEVRSTASEWWPGSSPYIDSPPRDDSVQISAINAAGLSARFPWVTPTGRLRVSDSEARILADGGYFDNSGAETVTDLVDALKISQNWKAFWETEDARQAVTGSPAGSACEEVGVRIVRNFHMGDDLSGSTPWNGCDIPIFLVYLALASDGTAVSHTLDQSFLGDPVAVLLQSRSSRGENALDHADLFYCGMRSGMGGAECSAVPGSSIGMFRNDVRPREWELPLGWYMSRSHFDAILKGTAADAWFDYRKSGRPAETETELMIYHLDPALNDDDADPHLGDLFANFGP